MTYVAPSLLAADFSALGAELKKCGKRRFFISTLWTATSCPI